MLVVVCISETLLLDSRHLATQACRAMLAALAAAGCECHSLSLNLCADPAACGADDIAAPADGHVGEWHSFSHAGVACEVYGAHSPEHSQLRPWELRGFLEGAEQRLTALQPDLVLTFSADLLTPLLLHAQRLGARTLFYLAGAGFTQREHFRFTAIDHFVAPAQRLATLYQQQMGLKVQPLVPLVPAPFDGAANLEPARLQARQSRFITLIDPTPHRGGLFFANLAARALGGAPGLRFRVVEGAWGRADWESKGANLALLTNTEWLPAGQDWARVFEQAALLVLPSLNDAEHAELIAMALQAGVPVLAMRSGSNAEYLNEGGFLFEVPAVLAGNPVKPAPEQTLAEWGGFIDTLMRDDALYARAVRLALKAGEKYRLADCQQAFLTTLQALMQAPPLASISDDEQVRATLLAQRARMRKALDSANSAFDAQPGQRATTLSDDPYTPVLKVSLANPLMRDAHAAVKAGELGKARSMLEQYLRIMPEDISALSLLAEVADQQERDGEARRLMERVLALAPGFLPAQHQLLRYLRGSGDAEAALTHSFALIERAPNQPRYLALHAGLLVSANRFAEAIRVYEAFFARANGGVHDWMQYALALKTLGRQQEAITAYRRAIELAPGHGAAWHALSNMKLSVFTDDDIAIMQAQLARTELSTEDRYNLHFTLGKALEDQRDFAPSFVQYAAANRIRREQSDYDIARLEAYVAQVKETMTAAFFAERADFGSPAQDPVFVLGLHRAGSTLVEQILASHSQIEGTRELPDMLRIGRDFGGIAQRGQERGFNRPLMMDLSVAEAGRLGEQYLRTSRAERQTNRPLFVDKMPGNWMYTGLIHLLLPNAKIIDIRREPMAAGFALFKMNFGRGVEHSYDQQDIARYYLAYADLMTHFDQVLPGRVHHIQYETLVADTDAEIRRLIDYCGLPFEAQCLRYWETERAIQTPSSEQVRQPIFTGAVEQWRHYAQWLRPMATIFGEPTQG